MSYLLPFTAGVILSTISLLMAALVELRLGFIVLLVGAIGLIMIKEYQTGQSIDPIDLIFGCTGTIITLILGGMIL